VFLFLFLLALNGFLVGRDVLVYDVLGVLLLNGGLLNL
jgi:hypothetical protein